MLLPRVLLLLVASLVCAQSLAAGKDLGVGIYLGVHKPALEDLNDNEFKSPIGGFATVFTGQGSNEQRRLNFQNPLPDLELGVNGGLEFQWLIDNDYSFVFGGGTWEATSRAVTSGGFYIQGAPADVINERVAKLSYNEFYFGLKRNIADIDGKYKLYYRLTLNEVFDVDYREDMVFLYTAGKAEGIKKTTILQSQATGLLMLQPGFGTDYFFREWLSVGVDASYVIGLKRLTLRDGTSDTNFLQTDNLVFWLPQKVGSSSGELEYLNHDFQELSDYSTIRLNFDGWKLLFKMNIYF
jgi:hypothetical protein